jgi:hypothetical protein
MDGFALWLKSTDLSWLITHYAWVWATCEVVHFIGMCWLFGCIGVLDLRLLGLWRQPPIAAVNKLVPWAAVGFGLNVITGAVFLIGEPLQYVHNPAFWFKMLFIVLAGWNVAMFYLTGLADRIEALDVEDDAPLAAKVVAASSLFFWVGVMFFGRMLPYIGSSF